MSEWQKGDLALCVDARPSGFADERGLLVLGAIERVADVRITLKGGTALYFDRFPTTSFTPAGMPRGWKASRFRKVTPPKADEFDREVIEAMTGAPVGEPA